MAKMARLVPGLVVALISTALTIGGYQSVALASALWVLAGVLLLVGAFPYLRRIRVGFAPQREGVRLPDGRVRPAATAKELASHNISDRTVWLRDLLDGEVIQERRFERCTIVGPAALMSVNPGNRIEGCSFSNMLPDKSNVLIPFVSSRLPEGSIKLQRVDFVDCDMLWCSSFGTPDWVERTKREGFGDDD
jgi:hypothetical protein